MISGRRTFVLLLLALAVPFGLFLLWAQLELLPQLDARATRQMARTAQLIGDDIGTRPFSDSLANHVGSVVDLRVTLIGRDGTVLGDSEVDAARLPSVENHADRPEVRAALAGEIGSDTRASGTISLRLLYVAVPRPQGVVRVAVPLDEVREFLTRTRQVAALSAMLAFVLASLLTGFLHRFWTAPVEKVRAVMERIGRGDLSARTGMPTGGGALSALGHSVDEMAGRIEERESGLRAERRELASAFERLDDGLALVRPDGHIQRVNPAFESWVGRGKLEGQRLASLFRDPQSRLAVERALAGEAARHESELGARTVQWTALPLAEGAVVAIRDLTRTRQLEGIRRDFVANVSHELKTPLTAMRGFAETLADGDMSPGQAGEFTGRILENVHRMQRLVDDLLDLTRIESGSWSPEPEEVELRSVLAEAWDALSPAHEPRGVTVACECPAEILVRVDRDAAVQILSNLLDNAIRYSLDGGEVRVSIAPENGAVRVSVADDGPGIPSAQLKRVFERFYRVDPARSREAGGTGLGLSIVKHLVAVHGGDTGIDSELGQGTTAWFTLPRSASDG